jgi:hypothetical protein
VVLAETIGRQITPELLGECLSDIDHDTHFPIISYAKLPDTKECSSLSRFLRNLKNQNYEIDDDYGLFFNGVVNPCGRECSIESIYSPDSKTISILFSCTRILSVPYKSGVDNENYFLARIPLVLKIFFDDRLMEFSLPYFSELISFSGWNRGFPARYQEIIDNAIMFLMQKLILTSFPTLLDLKKLSLFLEVEKGADDMGWKIAPQEEAEFDLTHNVIPLRDILRNFTDSIRREAAKRQTSHPLAEIDLYQAFRALKETSYTYQMVLDAPIGARGGSCKLSIAYPNPNDSYLPLVIFPKINANNIGIFRDAVVTFQKKDIENPYDLHSLFTN